MTRPLERLRGDLDGILRGAIDAINPAHLVATAHARGALQNVADYPTFVVAAGKAAWPMAEAFVSLASGPVLRGLIAGPQVANTPLPSGFVWCDGGHPFPNEASVEAGRRALAMARDAGDAHWLLVLLSGGASAMLAAPAADITLEDKVVTTRSLMRAGVAIDGLNCVRKHLSELKGGHLAANAARSLTLAISDVHGPVADDPSVIGSGPTIADPTTFRDALEIVRRAGSDVPLNVLRFLEKGADGKAPETVKPGDARLAGASFTVIGNRHTAVDGALQAAQAAGYNVHVIPDATYGEAREASHRFVSHARWLATQAARPLCVLASGETTVTVTGGGTGGRNQEFALAAAPLVGSIGKAAIVASIGTDGTDGPTDAAGALVDSSTLERSARMGVEWESALADNDAYHFFEPLGDLIIWGPTGTNVGDLHVMLIA